MIKIEVNKKNISIVGHANYDEYGKDIVCAAVSSVVITSIEAIALFDKDAIDVIQSKDKLELNSGMIELLKYLYENKNKYSLKILSAGHYIQVLRMLQRFNLTNVFDEIITIPFHIENEKIIITQGHKYDCDICNVGQCKIYEYNLFLFF